jgi:very-short-patch-repair endonuclease
MSLAALAGLQHGVVARWQLCELGFGPDQIDRKLRAGQLIPVHRGVYAVGHDRLTLRGRWMAAVLACGPDALLSHRAAATLWELRPAPTGPIDVTDPSRSRHHRRGIRVHLVRGLHDGDHGQIDNIPVTALARTLIDYADVARYQQLRLAVEAADRRDLLTNESLRPALARRRGRRGPALIERAIADLGGGRAPWTQSELERRFLALIRAAGLPEPRTNVLVAGELVDCYWPRERLVVEVDGYGFHKTRAKFESDRRLDVKLQLAGCRVLRATEHRIGDAPAQLASEIAALLSAGRDAAA